MKAKTISIVTDLSTARRVSEVISRLLNLQVEPRQPGSLRRIAAKVAELQPDVILYSWSGNEQKILDWLKAQHLSLASLEFSIYGYKGFSCDDAFAVNRQLAWEEPVQPIAFAA